MRFALGELSGLMKYANTAMKKQVMMNISPAIATLFFVSLRHGFR
jgi:hypothetical protein